MSRSIVMVDWSGRNEPTAGGRDQFLWHQMLLSLLYDGVFVQDQIPIVSKKFAQWFGGNDFTLFEELVACGGLGFIKRPIARYPLQLRDLADRQPIVARREHLAQFGSNVSGTPLKFTERHLDLHNRLEVLLRSTSVRQRYAGELNVLGKDLMDEFIALLEHVLTGSEYRNWLASHHCTISQGIANSFMAHVHDPEKAIDKIVRHGRTGSPRFTPPSVGGRFNTSIAVQLAATYDEAAADLQAVVESVFAQRFCEDEGAQGRYGKSLRSIPLRERKPYYDSDIYVVDVQYIEMNLPAPEHGFGDVINEVRSRRSCANLRNAMDALGSEPTFTSATRAWREVADDIASLTKLKQRRQFHLMARILSVAQSSAYGVAADLLLRPVHLLPQVLDPTKAALLGGVFELGADLCNELGGAIRRDIKSHSLADKLEAAIDFSCVKHKTVKDREHSDMGKQ